MPVRPLNCALPIRHLVCTGVALISLLSLPAQAASLTIDSFDAPASPSVSVLTSVSEVSFEDLTTSVPGGVRYVYHHSYINPLNSAVVLSVGNGLLSSSSGEQARTEVVLGYGASGPTGPRLGLDFTPYTAFHFEFTGVSADLNIVAGLYTSNPLVPDVYYLNAAVNVAPAVPGGPLVFDLAFTPSATFNYAQVDGITLLINRSNSNTGISYNLDSFSVTTAVPEPASALLLLAGIALVGTRARRAGL